MINHIQGARTAQRGVVLVSSLLLLLVVTIMALSMFRSFGIQEKIAGNMREKQRALQAAVTAEQFAEYWLTTPTGTGTASTSCSTLMDGTTGQGQICSTQPPNVLPDFATLPVPWQIGVTFTPTHMLIAGPGVQNTPVNPTYASAPTFYISDLGPDASEPGEVYQIDAVGYGGNSNTEAVVESTYAVSTTSKCQSCTP